VTRAAGLARALRYGSCPEGMGRTPPERRSLREELPTALLIVAVLITPFILIAVFGDVEPEGSPSAERIAMRIAAWATASQTEWKADMVALPKELGTAALQPLIDALGHAHRNVREGAAHALGELGADAAPAVQALTRAFEDEDDFVRWKAARALGNIGPAAASALPLLGLAAEAEQETEIVRASAQKAVGQIKR